jgi:hypothetical protein
MKNTGYPERRITKSVIVRCVWERLEVITAVVVQYETWDISHDEYKALSEGDPDAARDSNKQKITCHIKEPGNQ